MSRRINANDMTPEELEAYVRSLPEDAQPKISSAGWLGAFGVIALVCFFMRTNQSGYDAISWLILVGSIASFVGAGYILYRIHKFNKIS